MFFSPMRLFHLKAFCEFLQLVFVDWRVNKLQKNEVFVAYLNIFFIPTFLFLVSVFLCIFHFSEAIWIKLIVWIKSYNNIVIYF